MKKIAEKFRKVEERLRRGGRIHLSETQKDAIAAVVAIVGLLMVIVAIAFGALRGATGAIPDHSTLTVCRPQYGNCTEATR